MNILEAVLIDVIESNRDRSPAQLAEAIVTELRMARFRVVEPATAAPEGKEDRDTVELTDPMSAHYMSGWFAGYSRSGADGCPYATGTALRAFWVGGYVAGIGERYRTAGEHAARMAR